MEATLQTTEQEQETHYCTQVELPAETWAALEFFTHFNPTQYVV